MALKDDIKISIFNLDKATIEQPELFEKWSREWADAVFERDKLKEQLSVLKAELDEKIRLNPTKYGWKQEGKNPTEPWFASKIIVQPEHKELNERFIKAQYNVNIMSAGKETVEHRGKALSILTDLYKGNYFAAKARGEVNYQDTLSKKNTEAQSEGLNNSKRMQARMKND
jgi:hypothetical protein